MQRVNLKPLSQQTIVITGASSGIGLATAKMAADRGATVILVARSSEALEQACEEIRSHGGQADYVAADVGSHDEVRRVVDTVIERQGGFDTWVNDAGVGLYSRLEDISDEDHEKLFRTNYWGVVYGSIEAVKHLKSRGGAIINIGSILSDMGAPVLSAYAATKHAVKGFTDSLRLELIREDAPISLSLVKPSSVQSHFPDNARNYQKGEAMLPPPVYHPDVVARAILHAAAHPRRDFIVGGAGRLMTMTSALFPHLSDMLYPTLFSRLTEAPWSPRQDEGSALHHAAGNAETTSRARGHVRRTSLYTAIQRHPRLALGLSAVAGLVLAGALDHRRHARNVPLHRRVLKEMRRPLQLIGLQQSLGGRLAGSVLGGLPGHRSGLSGLRDRLPHPHLQKAHLPDAHMPDMHQSRLNGLRRKAEKYRFH